MATAKKATPAKKAAANKANEPAELAEPVRADDAAPARKTAAKKAATPKAAAKKAAKVQPPAEPNAVTRLSPTAAWPFPTGHRP